MNVFNPFTDKFSIPVKRMMVTELQENGVLLKNEIRFVRERKKKGEDVIYKVDLFDKKKAAQNIVNCYRLQNPNIKYIFNDIYNELKNVCIIHYVSKPWAPFSNCSYTWFNILMDSCEKIEELQEFLKWITENKLNEFIKIDSKPHPILNPILKMIL